jgi:hypothetical protein
MFLTVFPVAQVEATPITFIFEGTATGLTDNTRFTAAPFIIVADADTVNIVTVPPGASAYAPSGEFSLDTDSAIFAITGIGTGTFTLGTRVFVARGVVLNSQGPLNILGISRAGLNGNDLMDFTNPAFATYDLKTALGPLFIGNVIVAGAIPTTLGILNLDNVTDVTFIAATRTAVPEPSTWLLLGSGLAVMMLWRKRTA